MAMEWAYQNNSITGSKCYDVSTGYNARTFAFQNGFYHVYDFKASECEVWGSCFLHCRETWGIVQQNGSVTALKSFQFTVTNYL
jgi:hypothetical protein